MNYLELWENFNNDTIQHSTHPMLNHYLYTALWTEELEGEYDVNDFSEEAKKRAKEDCDLFEEKAGTLLDGLDLSTVGHDFWLTRNHHGVGFFDDDYDEEIGKKLTEISEKFGEIHLEVVDGEIHLY